MNNILNRFKILMFLLLGVISCKNYNLSENSIQASIETKDGEITTISSNLEISGIYPHLTTYSHGRENGIYSDGSECGIGALAVWNDKLYMINYTAHKPNGSEHKLYIVDKDKNMQIFEGSIGGTPAARMVHQESNQLLIGPYVIDSAGKVRVIPTTDMKGRLTAIARHLKDPENMVYYYDMEGMLYEVNVHSLEVNKLFHDPLPGWHGKGAYTSQGKLILANNGEHVVKDAVGRANNASGTEAYEWNDDWKIDKEGVFGEENRGILAEFDGDNFKVVERRQFTDITTKHGINAVPNDESPLWAIGWDKRSIRLKVLDQGKWHTYLLPKAAYNNDPSHGWFTEWPRIRAIGNVKMMMDMHGMFYDFPETFSAANTAGIKPMGSHLRYIPDFLNWNNQIVLATDETSIQGNRLAGQPQSNLWFGSYDELSNWGPATGYGAIWLKEQVEANKPSDAYLIAGFDNRMVHLKNHSDIPVTIDLEIDTNGDNTWKTYKSITLEKEAYDYHIFPKGIEGQWIRLVSNSNSNLTAVFHFTDSNLKNKSEGEVLFSALADIDYEGEVSHAKLYSNKTNFNLSVFAGTIENKKFKRTEAYEFTKLGFDYKEGIVDSTASFAFRMKNIWSEDDASIILKRKGSQLRLPKINSAYSAKFPSKTIRVVREVESERELANIAGTFYELPLFKVGQEPLYDMMRPVSTHGKQISDFNTWNGLLVLAGVKQGAVDSEHVFTSKNCKTSLWFGGIDDIWNFGKPVGEGGPWKNTKVKAQELSDKYLMTGYDNKTLMLTADKDTKVTLLVHVNHYLEEPMEYKTFELKAGETVEYKFPEGFSAHWAQVKSSNDCIATAWFVYN